MFRGIIFSAEAKGFYFLLFQGQQEKSRQAPAGDSGQERGFEGPGQIG
jgi:hypothetical protein